MSDQFSLATVDDLAGWLGETISEDTERVRAGWALAATTSLVLEETGQGEDKWPGPDIVPARVKHVVLACAARAFTNPESWNYEAVDDWRAGGRPVSEAGLFLTASERRTLAAFGATPASSGFGVVTLDRPVFPAVEVDPLADALLHGWTR